MALKQAFLVSLLLLILQLASSLTVTVGPNTEECFWEEINRAEKVLGSFNVARGGYLDIDVKVYNPDGSIVYEQERQLDGSFSFVALQKGLHKLCFGNTMSTVTAKAVSFNLYVGASLTSHGVAKQEHFTPLENSVLALSEGLKQVNNEQKYITTRERYNRDTTESTFTRMLWMTLFYMAALVVVAMIQILYLKRMFEKKQGGK